MIIYGATGVETLNRKMLGMGLGPRCSYKNRTPRILVTMLRWEFLECTFVGRPAMMLQQKRCYNLKDGCCGGNCLHILLLREASDAAAGSFKSSRPMMLLSRTRRRDDANHVGDVAGELSQII
jgi:hypothetical protein